MRENLWPQNKPQAGIAPDEAIVTISSTELTILAIRRDASIAVIIGLDAVPSPEELANIASQYPDCGLRLVPRSRLHLSKSREDNARYYWPTSQRFISEDPYGSGNGHDVEPMTVLPEDYRLGVKRWEAKDYAKSRFVLG